MAAGFNAPISGVLFAVETVLRRQPGPDGDNADDSGVTVAMVCALLRPYTCLPSCRSMNVFKYVCDCQSIATALRLHYLKSGSD